uniref:Uncharacterized protein n=1 Tax=Romanomermis culicivorax TaxID=13658 RepID=A0A915IGX1_ROMCU
MSLANPNHFYLFQKNKSVRLADDSITDCLEFRNCVKLGSQKGKTRVKNGRLISSREASHNQLCASIDAVALETLSLSRAYMHIGRSRMSSPIPPPAPPKNAFFKFLSCLSEEA